jgi:GNAT superfamily N-acetyltransferase
VYLDVGMRLTRLVAGDLFRYLLPSTLGAMAIVLAKGWTGLPREAGLESVCGCDEEVVLRTAIPQDADQLALLSGQLGYPVTPEQTGRRLEAIQGDESHAVFVAEGAGGRVIGWVHVFVRQLLSVGRHAELGGIVVLAEQRGHGLGRLLMEQAEGWARDRGCEVVYVRSNMNRERAHRFYEGIGYEQIKTSRVFLKRI